MIEFSKIYMDTSPFIFFLEKNVKYFDKVKDIVEEIFNAEADFVTSVITVEEYCVYPYREHNVELLIQFENFLNSLEVEVVEINRDIAKKAAQIRAKYQNFKSMDALQLASACVNNCDIFLTNDKQLKQFTEIQVVTVDEW